jgi:thioredoxin reductase
MLDVVIVGGGAAGLSAALVLGRARRRVLVCDAGEPRNAASAHAYGFLSRDGVPPSELRRVSLEQLQPYATVEVRTAEVRRAERRADGFDVFLADGRREQARGLILATGVVDELPEIPGLAELWGRSVFSCPYCHGWEVRDQPLLVYGTGEWLIPYTGMIRNWSQRLTVCPEGQGDLPAEDRRQLAEWGIPLEERSIQRIEPTVDGRVKIVFSDGDEFVQSGIFFHPPQRQRSDLAEQLGCRFDDIGLVETEANGYTGLAGLYAVGDMRRREQQLIVAAADGLLAAAALNLELIRSTT